MNKAIQLFIFSFLLCSISFGQKKFICDSLENKVFEQDSIVGVILGKCGSRKYLEVTSGQDSTKCYYRKLSERRVLKIEKELFKYLTKNAMDNKYEGFAHQYISYGRGLFGKRVVNIFLVRRDRHEYWKDTRRITSSRSTLSLDYLNGEFIIRKNR
jgi:hypothetical protein